MNLGTITAGVGQSWTDRQAVVGASTRAIKAASTIIIGGSGLVGIETAGCAREANPTARIVMTSRGKGPLQDGSFPAKYVEKLKVQLSKFKIEVATQAEVKDKEPCYDRKEYQLGSAGSVTADVYLPAYNQGFRAGFLREEANERGQVRVNKFMQSVMNSKMFAVGCADEQPVSAYIKIETEAGQAAANIKCMLEGKPMTPFKDSTPMPPFMKIGHSYAWVHYELVPPGTIMKCCGFPCCICLCCMGHPFGLGMCHGDPEGEATAKLIKSRLLHKPAGLGFKLGSPPQQEM
eukprot:TRINITY_DN48472_c0_g1_i1.p1 TRINITY_DN48472_c0_g1~~TRINITY_DN48472_c0_g1_i1.p1  ORF type:complete len:291 (-),score=53.91 TRINITY_DN48472_c0_g1_i1:147-1019(-)